MNPKWVPSPTATEPLPWREVTLCTSDPPDGAMPAPGAPSHPSFPLLPPATALYLYKPTGNGVKNQLAGNFWMQKVTCCLAAAQQAGLDFDSFNPKLTRAARLFFLITFQCCLSQSGRMKRLKSSLLLSGRSSPPFGWPKCAVDRICGAWFQRKILQEAFQDTMPLSWK